MAGKWQLASTDSKFSSEEDSQAVQEQVPHKRTQHLTEKQKAISMLSPSILRVTL